MSESIKSQSFHLKNGATATIHEAQPSDAGKLIDFLNVVGGESDFLRLVRVNSI